MQGKKYREKAGGIISGVLVKFVHAVEFVFYLNSSFRIMKEIIGGDEYSHIYMKNLYKRSIRL